MNNQVDKGTQLPNHNLKKIRDLFLIITPVAYFMLIPHGCNLNLKLHQV